MGGQSGFAVMLALGDAVKRACALEQLSIVSDKPKRAYICGWRVDQSTVQWP